MKAATLATALATALLAGLPAAVTAAGGQDAFPRPSSAMATPEPSGGITIEPPYTMLITVPSVPAAETTALALPAEESFEAYSTAGHFNYPTNGWSHEMGTETSIMPVSALPTTPPPALAFSGKCLDLDAQGTTDRWSVTGRADNIWIDLSTVMIGSDSWPSLPGNSLLGVGLLDEMDESTNEIIFQRLYVACGGTTNQWLLHPDMLFNPPYQAHHITLQLAMADTLIVPYFRLFLNQTNLLWVDGFKLPDVPSENGGPWLPCMATNRAFHGVGFRGVGYVDTIKISDTSLGPLVPWQTDIGQAVALTWASDYGERYQVETCTDLALGDWTPLGDPVVGNGTTNTVFEPTGAFPRRFYRVTPLR